MRFDLQFIKRTLADVSILNEIISTDPSFVSDACNVKSGDMFVALSTDHGDGCDDINRALLQGARGILMSKNSKDMLDTLDPALLKDVCIILVSNTQQALTALASAWRGQFTYPVIGITGSVGKTSVKEIVTRILKAAKKQFCVSHGNKSGKIELALNLLNMRAHHEYALFELGIDRRGQMDELVDMVRPTTSVVTNVGHCHMEGLGSIVDIALEKRQIFKHFTAQNIGIIHGDQPLLSRVSYPHPVIKFGLKTTNQIQARKVHVASSSINCTLKVYKDKWDISLPIPHQGILHDVLAAVAITHYLAIPTDIIMHTIQEPIVVARRFETKRIKGASSLLIDDGYNANPESMKAALLAFSQLETSAQKVVVLGDMLELGVTSPFWHRQIGRFLSKVARLKKVILIGSSVKWIKKTMPIGLSVDHVSTWQEAVDHLSKELSHDTLVLVKGSLRMELDQLVDHFTV